MQEMVLYFCHLKSQNQEHDRMSRFKLGEEPDYFNWLVEKSNDVNGIIVNHSITYYKTKIDNE